MLSIGKTKKSLIFLAEMVELCNFYCAVVMDGFSLLLFTSYLPLQTVHKQEMHTTARTEETDN